jgi:Tfp pilus assembly protein PilV
VRGHQERVSILLAGRTEPSRRRGFALVAALFALLLISALITGIFFAVMEETKVSSATAERQRALLAAESAVEMTIAASDGDWSGAIGSAVNRSFTIEGVGAPVLVHVTRLDSTLYWIVGESTAESRASAVSRRIGVVVRFQKSADHSITIDRISERSWSELF